VNAAGSSFLAETTLGVQVKHWRAPFAKLVHSPLCSFQVTMNASLE
jgi:hypothetical protein